VRGVAGLIRRRGSIVTWQHAIPLSGVAVDALTQNPKLSAGGPRKAMGPTGEDYVDPIPVRAYVSKKAASAFSQVYGLLDQRDVQLDLAYPFAPEPENGILIPDADLLSSYNAGQFCVWGSADDETQLVARDKFVIDGISYVVKASAVSLLDANRIVAWRLLLGALTY
jgi:hypothetical protein